MKTPRVLILTAGFGEGHNAAARALAAACDHLHGAGTAQVADLFAATSPRLNALSRWLYLAMINRTPRLWSAVYSWVDRSSMPPRLRGLLARERRLLGELIARTEPVAIASTYPVYAFLHADLARTLTVNVPFYNVVTDSISINSLWWRAGGAGWFMPNEDSARVLRGVGLGDDQLHVCGFPVAPFFAEHAGKLAPPDLAAGATPRVLYIINSGTQHALETARRLLAEVDWDVTFAVGRDDVLRQRLLRLAEDRPRPAQILGWTHEIPRLLMTHHAVVSKAGGATTQEAIAACCPMIVNQIVPGQEEGNYELLRRHGAGALAETPAAVVAELRAAFAAGGGLWRRWRTALTALSRPDAARQIARTILTAAPALEPIPLPLRLSPVPA